MEKVFLGAVLLALLVSVPIPTMAGVTPSFPATQFTDSVTGMEFVLIKGGCFEMGNIFRDGFDNEKPVHKVCVDDFYLGKYEITQGQWWKVAGTNPSYFNECGSNCPVEWVSWNDVQQFISYMNQRSGRRFRLPTEAEWEYAASSGGKREKWSGTNSEWELGQFAWYDWNSWGRPHPVGEKRPNGLGLHDMTGNVWEWCGDWYEENYYRSSPRNNPKGPSNGSNRVLRGGAFYNDSRGVRVAVRGGLPPSYRFSGNGFRVGLSAQ